MLRFGSFFGGALSVMCWVVPCVVCVCCVMCVFCLYWCVLVCGMHLCLCGVCEVLGDVVCVVLFVLMLGWLCVSCCVCVFLCVCVFCV